MKPYIIAIAVTVGMIISAHADDGTISIKSAYSVKKTGDRLVNALEAKGMNVFARIDHAAGARKVGKQLRPTELILFGNPKVGTPLMQCQQKVAIDLPQKALIWKDASGQVWLSYNDPNYLAQRHGISQCKEVITKISNALANFGKKATAP